MSIALVGLVLTAVLLLFLRNWSILAAYASISLVVLAFRARQRVVIQEFVDHSVARPDGQAQLDQPSDEGRQELPNSDQMAVSGVSKLLVTELAELRGLYQVVNERRAIGTAVGEGQPLDATVRAEAASEFFQSAVSAESTVSLGPLKIPVGSLMGLMGRLVQGPHLTGAVHAHGADLILTAQLTGGPGRSRSWRVERAPAEVGDSSDPRSRVINDMIEELACRMFTDLTLSGSVNWRATQHFIRALRAFRRCLRVPRRRKTNLRRAEDELIEAFAEDDGFVLVFYNLGVVYTELWRMAHREAKAMQEAYDLRPDGAAQAKMEEAADHLQAAEVAFARAIDQDPGRWEAYYALALARYERGRRESVIEHCERVLQLHPSRANRAKAYDLKGLAEFHHPEPLLASAVASARRAATLSLQALRRAELKMTPTGSEVDPVPALGDQSTRCLLNLAVALAHEPPKKRRDGGLRWRSKLRLYRVTAIFHLALSLTNKDAILHSELGRITRRWGRSSRAVTEFTKATRIDPENASYWADLAAANADLYQARTSGGDDRVRFKREANHACKRSMEAINLSSTTDADRETRRSLADTYLRIGEKRERRRLQSMANFARKVGVYEWNYTISETAERALLASLERYRGEGDERAWEAGHVARLLGIANLNKNKPAEASDRFREAIRHFTPRFAAEIRRYGIYARLATAVAAQADQKAVVEAQHALALDPLRQLERMTLGQMYFDLRDYERAQSAWQGALLWSPNDPEVYWNLSECHRLLAEEERRPARRRARLDQAAEYLEQALELYGGADVGNKLRAHYWLGRLYSKLGDFHRVIAHLRLVQADADVSILGDLLIGEAFLKVKAYEQAEHHFGCAIEASGTRLPGDALVSAGKSVGDDVPVALVIAWAHWGRAFSAAERGGNLERAKADVTSAEGLVAAIEPRLGTDSESRVRLDPIRQSCAECRGWICLREDRIDDAIQFLRTAVSLGASGETYVRLARACEVKWRTAESSAARVMMFGHIQNYCELARDTDVTGDTSVRADEILERIGQLERSSV